MEHFILPFKKFLKVGTDNKSTTEQGSNNQPASKPHGNNAKFNIFGPLWFLITVAGIIYLGLEYVFPLVYTEDSCLLFFHKVVMYVILIELMVNWCFLKFVHSPYTPAKEHILVLDSIEQVQQRMIEMNKAKGIHVGRNCGNVITEGGKPVTSSVKNNSSSNSTHSRTPSLSWDTKDNTDSTTDKAEDDSKPKRYQYPYWCWKVCLKCECLRPPRTHHCAVCDICVIKRDHHCFFTGACVGLRNQRYFLVFLFWGIFACFLAVFHGLCYFYSVYLVGPDRHWADIVLPIGIVKYFTFNYDICYYHLVMLILLYSVLWFSINAVGFFWEQFGCIKKGITMHELDTKMKIITNCSQQQNMKSVFGSYWLLNFIVPLHWIFTHEEDGIAWSNVKVLN